MDRAESLIFSGLENQLLWQVLIHQCWFVNKNLHKKQKKFTIQDNIKLQTGFESGQSKRFLI